MKKFLKIISRILLLQEVVLRGILVIIFTSILFAYYIVLIPFLHIYKFLKSGLLAMDELSGEMVKSIQELYAEIYEGHEQ